MSAIVDINFISRHLLIALPFAQDGML